MEDRNELTRLLVVCSSLARGEGEAATLESTLASLRESLRAIFTILAELAAANPERRGWTADPKKPGYLVRGLQRDGEFLEIHVPLTILDSFPPSHVLEEMAHLARRIRSGPDTAICLSGSAAVYAALEMVGDLDFCEYVERGGDLSPMEGMDQGLLRTLVKAASLESEDLLCLEIDLHSGGGPDAQDKREVKRPWNSAPTRDEELLTLARKARAGKCDFVAQCRFEGTIEVTNLVLLIDPEQPDQGSGKKSFPFQEAPLTSTGGWVPRNLDEPLVLGRYINWLAKEAEKQIGAGKLGKAAKRVYALANALFRSDLADQILDLLDRHWEDLVLGSTLLARLELRARLRSMSADPFAALFEDPLVRTLSSLAARAQDLALPELHDPSDGEGFSIWCEAAADCLRSPLEGREALRSEIWAVFRELTGLLEHGRP